MQAYTIHIENVECRLLVPVFVCPSSPRLLARKKNENSEGHRQRIVTCEKSKSHKNTNKFNGQKTMNSNSVRLGQSTIIKILVPAFGTSKKAPRLSRSPSTPILAFFFSSYLFQIHAICCKANMHMQVFVSVWVYTVSKSISTRNGSCCKFSTWNNRACQYKKWLTK